MVGHDPFRGSSAYGNISLRLNTSASNLINGNIVIINNFTRLRISETGENYFLNLPSDYIKLELGNSEPIPVSIIQGEIETQVFTSDGTALQTFNPIVKSMTDNDNVAVTVNGKEWKKVDSLYDMPADDEYGSGECFMATYIKTSGDAGNVYTKTMNVNFLDDGYDETGIEVNLNDVLDVETLYTPSLGANYESPEFTKMIAPRTSKSFVLANPENYVTFLSRYNQFSFVYAYNTKEDDVNDDINFEDDNITYLKIVPNIKRKISNNQDFFDIPLEEFYLSDDEKDSIASAIYNSGRTLIGTEVSIEDITVERFIINIMIRNFENSSKQSIRSDIRNILSRYFLNINRNDIVPLSDIISLVEGIDGVDTCDVIFITEKNENAKFNGQYTRKKRRWMRLRQVVESEIVPVSRTEDPRVDFDDFGNIIIGENELYIPKGGWRDNDGNYYTETIEPGKLGPLNIFFLDEVSYSSYNQNMQRKLNNLLK